MTRKVHIATPTTLVTMLRTAQYAWQQAALSDNARAVFDLDTLRHGDPQHYEDRLGLAWDFLRFGSQSEAAAAHARRRSTRRRSGSTTRPRGPSPRRRPRQQTSLVARTRRPRSPRTKRTRPTTRRKQPRSRRTRSKSPRPRRPTSSKSPRPRRRLLRPGSRRPQPHLQVAVPAGVPRPSPRSPSLRSGSMTGPRRSSSSSRSRSSP